MLLYLCILFFIQLPSSHSAQIPCVTFSTPSSGTIFNYINGPISLTCGDGGYPNYTVVDCECGSAWRTCNGSTIINNTCHTYPINPSTTSSNSRNRASINCCDLNSPFGTSNTNDLQTTCISRYSSISSSTAGSTTQVSCNSDETLLGCMGLSPGGNNQGSCIGSGCGDNLLSSPPISGVFNASDDTCVAVKGSTGNQGIIAQALCCKFENNDISISCQTKWSDISGTGDDDLTYVDCSDSDSGGADDYFMTNCGAVKSEAGSRYDGSFFLNEDGGWDGIESNANDRTAVCVGWNGGDSSYGIYAQALCCKYTTSAPTNAPSHVPSNFPTISPSSAPTS